jgi:hypothetical protein
LEEKNEKKLSEKIFWNLRKNIAGKFCNIVRGRRSTGGIISNVLSLSY